MGASCLEMRGSLLARPGLEVADIFRRHGQAWRQANAGHVSPRQLNLMSAIENCCSGVLGGHVARCEYDKCGAQARLRSA
jgi:hypothetical protein